MPRLSIVLDINQHGDQTFRVEGDPSLWPLVGRIAAAASPIQQPTATVVINNMSGENAQDRRQAHDHKINTALVTLGWKGVGDLQAWAEMTRERIQAGETHEAARAVAEAAAAPIRERLQLPMSTSPLEVLTALFDAYKTAHTDAKAIEGQVDSIDAVLRPLVIAHDEDGPEEVADLVAARIRGAEEQDTAIRAVLEEAIGRTPDPSRSTLQLAHDLIEMLKAAVMRR